VDTPPSRLGGWAIGLVAQACPGTDLASPPWGLRDTASDAGLSMLGIDMLELPAGALRGSPRDRRLGAWRSSPPAALGF